MRDSIVEIRYKKASGQSYKHFTIVNYDARAIPVAILIKHFTIVIYDFRVIPDLKLPHITTLESLFTSDWPQELIL